MARGVISLRPCPHASLPADTVGPYSARCQWFGHRIYATTRLVRGTQYGTVRKLVNKCGGYRGGRGIYGWDVLIHKTTRRMRNLRRSQLFTRLARNLVYKCRSLERGICFFYPTPGLCLEILEPTNSVLCKPLSSLRFGPELSSNGAMDQTVYRL
jgi:hypothetical protein